jgi:hypothetical protein
MIARIWRGAVAQADGDSYADYVAATGLAGYTTTEEIGSRPPLGSFAATSAARPRS